MNGGAREAFVVLYERHRDFVHAVAWRMLGDGDLAAEALQEVFLHWLGRFPGFELRARVTTYLYPVVRNVSIEIARRRRRAMRIPVVTADASAAGPVPSSEADPEVAALLARLSAGQQEVVLLRFAHGLELHEIAVALEIPLGTVKSRLHAAMTRLGERAGEEENLKDSPNLFRARHAS